MRCFIGLDYRAMRENRANAVVYDPTELINGHMVLSGMSGTGKSFTSLRFLNSAARSGYAIDVFDVHEELHGIDGAVTAKYSQATGYGFNPLVLDTDKHEGGPLRQIELLVGLIKSVSPLGINQEMALRNLMAEVYRLRGIQKDKPNTWAREIITEREWQQLKDARRYGDLRAYYPTLGDLLDFAWRKIQALKIGGDKTSTAAFEALVRARKQLDKQHKAWRKAVNVGDREQLEIKIEDLENKAVEAYSDFIRSMETGSELDDITNFDNADTLQGVVRRLELINSAGIFLSNPPPFGDARVRVHQIKSLTPEQQVLFTKLRLREIFEQCKALGPTASGTEIRRVIFLDEAHKFFSDEGTDILNVIAKEGRKFGVALWVASQDPRKFPTELVSNCGATVFLGLHSSFWTQIISKFRIPEATLRQIKPKEVLAIRLQREGEGDPEFMTVAVPNPNTELGRKVADWFAAASRKSKPAAAGRPQAREVQAHG